MQKKFNFLIYGYRHSVLRILQMIVIKIANDTTNFLYDLNLHNIYLPDHLNLCTMNIIDFKKSLWVHLEF